MGVAPLHRTLEQELQALIRGVSLECLVCGEFVLHAGGMVTCPECNASLREKVPAPVEGAGTLTQLQFGSQAG